jgi:heavy metal efflux system protein
MPVAVLAFGLTRRAVVMQVLPSWLLTFIGAAVVAFADRRLSDSWLVILEITGQAPGLSAEEMERYYTIPMVS